MVRLTLTFSVLILCIVSLAVSHQPEVPDALKSFSGTFKSQQELYSYALMSTCLISAAPFFILFFIPLDNAAEHDALLKVLLSFASGGLLGDAFLHLIPHAISSHDHNHDMADSHHHHHDEGHHDHHHHKEGHHEHHHHNKDHHHHLHHDHHHHHESHHDDGHHHRSDHHDNHTHSHDHTQDMVTGLWVLAGIFVFLMVEKFVIILKGGKGHTHLPPKETKKVDEKEKDNKQPTEGTLRQRKKTDGADPSGNKNTSHHHHHHGNIKVSAYLNLAADFAHNFTDGLAIGASYLAGRGVGIVTTITILLHEVPHEIGDFAILIQSGYPKRKAMMLQLVTAVGAIAGTVCGLMAEGTTTAATSWILPFTAGGFIYIATVSVIPELLENSSAWQSVKELIGLSVGVGMMVLIAVYE